MSVINTNYLSLVSQNNLAKSQSTLGSAIERLSSGMRINSAKDDAAGQAIANRMTSQVRGMTQAARNANDGISLAQTAEGNLNEINNNLQRIRELAVQASNETNTPEDLGSIQKEIVLRVAEIDRVASSASFNGKNLLDGTNNTIRIQVGAATSGNDQISVTLIDAKSSAIIGGDTGADDAFVAVKIDVTTAAEYETDGSLKTKSGAHTAIDAIDYAIEKIDTARSDLGAIQNRFESTIANLNNTVNNLSAARSRIEDADYAVEVSNMTRAQILQQAGTSVLAQANQVPQGVLSLLR